MPEENNFEGTDSDATTRDDSSGELVVAPSSSSNEADPRRSSDDSDSAGFFDPQTNFDTDESDEHEYLPRTNGHAAPFESKLSKWKDSKQKISSLLTDQLPKSPQGWSTLLAALTGMVIGYEIQLQKHLTQPPTAFGQLPRGSTMSSVFQKLTRTPQSIFRRSIQPSLFVGTRGVVSSTAAYMLGGPPSSSSNTPLQFREIVTSSSDGAQFAVDWEIPQTRFETSQSIQPKASDTEERKQGILNGPIKHPVVVILHGINNDASFGYMKSLARTFVLRGWNAASLNFRGCGGVPLSTPRGYTGAYTGDLRNFLLRLSSRMAPNAPVFLVGNSLGANILTKYLGEEGLSGTLPNCVCGAAGLGNPLLINSSLAKFPFDIAMAVGVKKLFLQQWTKLKKMTDPLHRRAFHKSLMVPTIGRLDQAMAPILIRNGAFYPFAMRLGYKNGEAYWMDSSSFRLIRFIPIPFLNLTAKDDFLARAPSMSKLGFCIANPNVLVVETRCGGHLGWQESPPKPESAFGRSSSWASVASADFFDAVMASNVEKYGSKVPSTRPMIDGVPLGEDPCLQTLLEEDAKSTAALLQSRM